MYMIADAEIFVFFINNQGELDREYAVNLETELSKDAMMRLMVQDSTIITLCDKQITVFQFQNQSSITLKQSFQAFKDIEDIAISRSNGMRIFKVKGSKGKFKVFSTLPSSDWNPYIEGVSKKGLLDDREFTKIDLLDAKYENVIIVANTGKHSKFFVVDLHDSGQRNQPVEL